MICDAVPGATVLGLQRPCIAIPSSLVEALTTDELDQVILHEHAHVQRRDDWSRLAERLLMSVLWIHPAALLASRALNREREMACDEWVVARTGLPKVFATCLVHAAEVRGRTRSDSTLMPALVGRRHELVRRVDRLLALRGKTRSSVSLAGAGAAACGMLLMAAQLQGVRLVEIAEIVFPQVSRPMMALYNAPATVRFSAAARAMKASAPVASAFAPDSHIASADKPVAPAFAPNLHIASADKPVAPSAPVAPDAPNAPIAPVLSARVFMGAYVLPLAPIETSGKQTNPWQAMATPGVEIASAAKKTSLGIANIFSRAGVSLARSF
jgi:hypothetical protein